MKKAIISIVALAAIVLIVMQVAKSPTSDALIGDQAAIIGHTWAWEQTTLNDGTIVTPRQAESFSITLTSDGQVSGQTDCNGFFGTYEFGDDGAISFGPLASTLMYCEGSQENEFTKMISDSDQYLLTAEGKLVLNIKFDSGSVIFVKQP